MLTSLVISTLAALRPNGVDVLRSKVSAAPASTRREAVLGAASAALLLNNQPAFAAKNSVNFANVKTGDTVPTKFTYKFEVTGYTLSPAADGIKEGTGHHHLVIDGPGAFVTKGEAIPFDATHKHFGKAQTEGELELTPGKHKLTLQFANALHESYGAEFAKTITVNVKGEPAAVASAAPMAMKMDEGCA